MKQPTFSTFSVSQEHLLEQTPCGAWVIVGESHLNKWVRETGRLDHDLSLLPEICRYITPNSVVIDVGANIGDHTIAYLRATGPNGIVIAYEPHPLACECLRRNCPEALAFQCAVGAEVGRCQYSPEPYNVGASFLSEQGEDTVIMTTLDSDFNQILSPLGWKSVSMIKIDVEGSEPEVLKGAERLITQYRPILCVEINHATLARRGYTFEDVKSFMETHGYQIQLFPYNQFGWDHGQYDIICLPC